MAPPEVPARAVPITGGSLGAPLGVNLLVAAVAPDPLALMAATENENASPLVSLLNVYERVDAGTTVDHGFMPLHLPASRLTR